MNSFKQMNVIKYNRYAIFWAIVILILTLTPGNAMPSTESINIPNSDKIVHFFIFGVFAYLLMRGFTQNSESEFFQKNSVLISFSIAAFFGILTEILQTIIPGRGFDLLDIVANTSGIALGLSVFYLKDNLRNTGFRSK